MSGGTGGVRRPAAPALATTTRAIAAHARVCRCSCRKTNPARAASAGSSERTTLKTCGGSRRSASSSSDHGSAAEALTDANAEQEVERPEEAGRRRKDDSERVHRTTAAVGEEADARAGEHDPQQVYGLPRAQHRDGERAEELDGHRDAERGPVEGLVERDIHRDEHDAEGRDEPQVGVRTAAELR